MGQVARPPVETGVWYRKPAEARLTAGAIPHVAVRFNALCVAGGGFTPRRRRHAPTLNDAHVLWVTA